MAEMLMDGQGDAYYAKVNRSGALLIGALSGTDFVSLTTDSLGNLRTTATVSVAGISVGSASYIYGKSGANWFPLLVESGTGKLITTTTVTTGSESYNFVSSGGTWVAEPFVKEVNVSGTALTTLKDYTTKIDYSGTSNPIYIAKSLSPSNAGSSTWQIKKLTYDGDNVTDIQWANGSTAFSFVYNSRDSYTYS